MKKITLIIGFILFGISFSLAQKVVTGTITDTDGDIASSVVILEKGTNNGTLSDLDGKYSITVSDNAVLVFTSMGYKTKEVPVNESTVINVVLELDAESLEKVVVIGYGSVSREKITSSISSVKGEDIEKFVASNPADGLQGRAAGVQVLSGGSTPGASPQILIRGITTANGTTPLIVVDGVPLAPGSSLNLLNAGDIDSFEVLKDASASAIYGSRASNGVILVTTKRGKEGKTVFTARSSYGVQRLQKIQMAGSAEYIEVMNLRRTNDGQAPLFEPDDLGANTDWWDQTVQNFAPITNIDVRASGGTDKIKFAGSLGYFNQDSSFEKGWYERITGRFNIDFKISDKITLKQDLNPRFENFENTPNPLFNTLRIDPRADVYLPQNERQGRNIYSIYAPSNNLVPNPVGQINRIFDETRFFELFSNTQLNYEIIDGLSVNSQLGLSVSNQRRDQFFPEFFTTPNQQRVINSVSRTNNETLDYVFNNTINYKKDFGKHYVNALAGVLWDSQTANFISGTRDDVPGNTNPDLWFLSAATGENISVSSNESVENIFSTIFRGIYSYDDRYFFTGVMRIDESSKFAKNNRTGYFPSVSVGWDIDSEKFFNISEISNLRLTAGYGQIGNQNISRNGQFFAINDSNFVFNDNRVVTNFLSQFGNPNLTWETVEDINLGLTSSFFDSSLKFTAEYYEKTSRDLLFFVELPNYTGIPGRVAQNVGSFKSSGFDFNVGYSKKINDFNVNLNLNISTNASRVVELAEGNEQLLGQRRADFGNRFVKISEVGSTVGLFYGFKTDGLFQNQTEINAHTSENGTLIQPNAQPGDLKYVDANGDGILNDEDLTVIGDPFADFYGGFSADVTYKNWDLSMQWYGTFGNDVFNYPSTFLYAGNQDVNVAQGTIGRTWSPDNTGASFPRLSLLDRNGNYQRPSDLFIEDGSYLRLRNIQVGYSFEWENNTKVRIYASGQNLLTFTKYSGFDPEVSAGGDVINDFGVDYARTPIAKTYLLGINLTL